jgi:hypothetical protein
MKEATRKRLEQIENVCNLEGRSTEYMIQYMQDTAGVSFECVMAYLGAKPDAGKGE